MTSYRNSMSGVVGDYSQLKTIPAMLGILFTLSSLYQFGGISEVHLAWIDYTLTTEHAMMVSLGTFLVAFASSETKSFERYDDWEKGFIAAAPGLVLLYEVTQFVPDLLLGLGDPLGPMLGFLVTVAGWGVAVR
jgi:hypothetical protein